ncbi:hypothetical protein EBU71_01220 [bacterium]|nr:hypothetical protein [Candidatus Elulimicrobium humile]
MSQILIDLIRELRAKILVHSHLYWIKNQSLVEDSIFDKWKLNLIDAQNKFEIESSKDLTLEVNFFDETFKNWDGKNTRNLPIYDKWVMDRVEVLMSHKDSLSYL